MKQDRVKLALIGTGAWSGAIGDAMLKSKKIELVTCFDPVSKKERPSVKNLDVTTKNASKTFSKGMMLTASI